MSKYGVLTSVAIATVGGSTVVLGGCHARTMRLVNPDPIVLRSSMSMEQIREKIWDALKRRRWYVTEEEPGVMIATVSVRTHSAKVRIDFDTESIRLSYLDSENLKYRKTRKGEEYIHKNYHVWIRHLTRELADVAHPFWKQWQRERERESNDNQPEPTDSKSQS